MAVSATLLLTGAFVLRLSAVGQADPHTGTWILNVAQSRYVPGPLPREQTTVYTVAGDTLGVSTNGTSWDGKPIRTDSTVIFDGKAYPVAGSPDYDVMSARRVDSHTIEFTRKRAGSVVQTTRSIVSRDGQTRTVTTIGVDAKGQKIHNVSIYEKKG